MTNLEEIKQKLSHHLHPRHDPCQDRGSDWPCDVAETLLTNEEIVRINIEAEKELLERINNIKKKNDPRLDRM